VSREVGLKTHPHACARPCAYQVDIQAKRVCGNWRKRVCAQVGLASNGGDDNPSGIHGANMAAAKCVQIQSALRDSRPLLQTLFWVAVVGVFAPACGWPLRQDEQLTLR